LPVHQPDGRLRNSYPASYIPQRTADISQSLFEEGNQLNIAKIRCRPAFAGASAGWPAEKFLSGQLHSTSDSPTFHSHYLKKAIN